MVGYIPIASLGRQQRARSCTKPRRSRYANMEGITSHMPYLYWLLGPTWNAQMPKNSGLTSKNREDGQSSPKIIPISRKMKCGP